VIEDETSEYMDTIAVAAVALLAIAAGSAAMHNRRQL
jgi:hypothetical protein